ncbi:hypothetical protein, partial [Thiothrix sp. UBA2332]|uniref:hypothetical protein n=1 Tax=Thiothrix sp. UBA2332 TaxID=1947696 RepID=UPI0025F012D7
PREIPKSQKRIITFNEATYHHGKTGLPSITDWKIKQMNDIKKEIKLIETIDPDKAAKLLKKLLPTETV